MAEPIWLVADGLVEGLLGVGRPGSRGACPQTDGVPPPGRLTPEGPEGPGAPPFGCQGRAPARAKSLWARAKYPVGLHRVRYPPQHPTTHPQEAPPMNINKALDKAWEGKPFKELAEAPVSALAGVTEKDAELDEDETLRERFVYRVGRAPGPGVPAPGKRAAEADRRGRVPQHPVQLRARERRGGKVRHHPGEPEGYHQGGWRRGWDSNPRYGISVYTLSRRAPSTARPPLQGLPRAARGLRPGGSRAAGPSWRRQIWKGKPGRATLAIADRTSPGVQPMS